VDIHFLLGAIGVAGLLLAGAAWLLDPIYGPDPDLTERRRMARPEALPGCFGCALAASASDDHLATHLRREHAA